MVHIVCAVILYLFWFEKPLDVRTPEIVHDPSWDSPLALVVQKTMYDDQLRGTMRYHISEGVQLVMPTDIYPNPNGAMHAIRDRARALGQQLSSRVTTATVSAEDEELWPGDTESVSGHQRPVGAKNLSFAFFELSVDLKELFQVTQRAPGLLVLSLVIYGGIHLSVWNFEFPSGTERLLWKIASIGIAATSPVLFSIGLDMKMLLQLVKILVEIVSGRQQSWEQ
ncbi:hypothetical protein THAR02_07355 [Trichoderma harzianum]|uniref:Uncharacterized protein n=1 Tax=Trichoderma harzianum TaxID=5544 RepID=A0A0F9X5V9_TRIHA|nr:hypothetical protein THAR02_07355 [Trichoderma harzianum]